MTRQWKRSDITDEMVCRAYLPQMQRLKAEQEAEATLTLGDILAQAFARAKAGDDDPGPEFADAVLQRDTGAPWKVVYSAMERASDRGLIDYGVTLRSGWLTDKGKALLAPKEEAMTPSQEEIRQGEIRDVLRPAYDARKPVSVELRDGSERRGLLDEFQDALRTSGPELGHSYVIRFQGDSQMIPGSQIMAGTITSGG